MEQEEALQETMRELHNDVPHSEEGESQSLGRTYRRTNEWLGMSHDDFVGGLLGSVGPA